MAILKCKMCGGDLDVKDGANFATCNYCGAQQTLPTAADEQKANLFNRANHFRQASEFDRAISAYENILNLDDSDAEAHWGLVLSKYGIEYVKDPRSGERIPTLHRLQTGSILSDHDYLAALERAPDAYSKSLYEKEAAQIAGIQKDTLALSAKEAPYDVFICYKEQTDGGSRTKDSVLAQDVYYQLEKAGYKVFFSRISLESKLGREYEPYIFAALGSARVMLVIGTQPEYFNAVWVRNEWSRYLALMKKDSSKLLIPCYRDMDPYDLPEALSMLQSLDMSKIGFVQDLLHGVKKVLDSAAPVFAAQTAQTAAVSAAAPGVESLCKRAMHFLEDGDFGQAEEYLDRVLDIDPEYAPAYVGKLMAERGVKTEDALANTEKLLSESNNFQRAIRFGDAQLKGRINGYNQTIEGRIETKRKQGIYEAACTAFDSIAVDSADKNKIGSKELRSRAYQYQDVLKQFRSLEGFSDSGKFVSECERFIDQYNKEADIAAEKEAAEAARVAEEKRIEAERERLERERKEEQTKIKAEQARRRDKRIAIIGSGSAAAAIAIALLFTLVITPAGKYSEAGKLAADGKYAEAIAIYESLGNYKESANEIAAIYKKPYKELIDGGVKTIPFGAYKWRVLAVEDNKALLITEDIIDKRAYNDELIDITWENCTLRKYLNETFYGGFSDDEKARILETNNSNPDNAEYGTAGGADTLDKVFLLSIDEAERYFTDDASRIATYDGEAWWWWLRSPGHSSYDAAIVLSDGHVDGIGSNVDSDDGARPALWLNLDS